MDNEKRVTLPRSTEGNTDWDLMSGYTGTEEGYGDAIMKLKPRHYRAITLLLQGYSYTEVSNELEVTKRTVLRWFSKGSICYEILCARRYANWLASQQQLVNLHSDAILEMRSLIHSDTETTRLKAASFILGNLKPEMPVNLEGLSEIEIRKYDELRRYSSAFYVRTRTGVIGDYTKYAIDPEDNIYREEWEYPEDGFDHEEPDPADEPYQKIELSEKQIKFITTKLTSAGVFTENYLTGVVIRDKDGFVVGELHPKESSRPSYAREDRHFLPVYRKHLIEFFEHRPIELVTHRWRDARGIPHTDDLKAIIKMFIALGSISIPERLEEEEAEDRETVLEFQMGNNS